jgi:uncharacterized membrane protein
MTIRWFFTLFGFVVYANRAPRRPKYWRYYWGKSLEVDAGHWEVIVSPPFKRRPLTDD